MVSATWVLLLTAQIFDATDEDNRHVAVERLEPERWTTLYIDFSRDGRRNDGGDTRFAAGHLVDDLFLFASPSSAALPELLIDEVVLYDAAPQP